MPRPAADSARTAAAPAPATAPESAAVDGIEAWVFDLDNTLYPPASDLFAQVDRRMTAFVSRVLGLPADAARTVQKQYYREHGTTLRGLMTLHDVDPHAYLDFVHDIDVSPVPPDRWLDAALADLPGRKFVFTNGSTAHAERVMDRLGVARHFEAVFDIVAAGFRPKPEPATYRRMADVFGLRPPRAAMFEDIPRNLEPAAALGMVTVLVVPPDGDGESAPYGPPGADRCAAQPHIDHVTDDLAGWLAGARARPAADPA